MQHPASTYSRLSRTLVDVAMGRAAADLVIRNGRWVCVQSGEIIPETDIAVKDQRIAYIGPDASHTIDADTQLLDAGGRYRVPGLLDGHMHVESGMITVTEFVRAVAPRGTTGMFVDPHEIANVLGLRGVRLMVDEARQQPIHVWVQMPSCVPSAPGLETPGASIGPEEVAEAMSWEGIIGLGEMMNFPGVFNGDQKMHDEMAETRAAGKVVGGHYASLDLGLPFHGYVAGGAEDDHEGTRVEDALARVRLGMKAMLRLGSAWYDVASQVKAVTEMGLDPRHFILCTDDSHSGTLVQEGHMDRVLRHAIAQGVAPITAVQMMTINTAEHFGLARDIGMIAPGRYADIVLTTSLPEFQAELVIARGEIIASEGRLVTDPPPVTYPQWATDCVKLGRRLTADDFRLEAPSDGPATANVIGVIENQAPTRHLRLEVEASDGEVRCDLERDIAKIALVERHQGTGEVQVALVQGFGFNVPCAVGTTVAHDSHHMIIVGTDEADMAKAANELARVRGGQIVVRDGEVLGLVELPIAGLMSDERAEDVAEKASRVLEGFRACGCALNNANMQLSLLALVVIPDLRISDKGLVDVNQFDFVPVLE
ncbi:MAG TPA: adenine deaminase [Candidatus Sulfomarinibacteraceae bacterium]|nr:adenine deaminase [Candidatus Sulfomarinibacteraceae bacterium]